MEKLRLTVRLQPIPRSLNGIDDIGILRKLLLSKEVLRVGFSSSNKRCSCSESWLLTGSVDWAFLGRGRSTTTAFSMAWVSEENAMNATAQSKTRPELRIFLPMCVLWMLELELNILPPDTSLAFTSSSVASCCWHSQIHFADEWRCNDADSPVRNLIPKVDASI